MVVRSTCLFIIFFLSNVAIANKKGINTLRDKITNQSNNINKLAAQIQNIDIKISTTNDNYLDRMKEIEKLEIKVENIKLGLNKSASAISTEYNLTKIAFNQYLLESTDKQSEDSLLSKKIYLDLLSSKLKKLKDAQSNSNNLLSTIQMYEQNLSKKKRDEELIYHLIMDLENKKRGVSHNYISLMENKNLNQNKLDKLVAKKKAFKKVYSTKKESSVIFKLGLPLDKFVNVKKSKDGLTFKYSETSPIKAPRSGKVVYAGELASYGKVLIIDHGQDVRSVLLGDLVVKVAKGDMVENNQIVGYTVADSSVIKSLYYEIRKKNVAQNTMKWLSRTIKKNLNI